MPRKPKPSKSDAPLASVPPEILDQFVRPSALDGRDAVVRDVVLAEPRCNESFLFLDVAGAPAWVEPGGKYRDDCACPIRCCKACGPPGSGLPMTFRFGLRRQLLFMGAANVPSRSMAM
jgi:hypothetical protein